MLRAIPAIIVIACAIALLVTESAEGASPMPCPVQYEDERGWDWTLCGNGLRGVVTMNGTPVVVGINRYCRLLLNGNLDRTHRSQRMLGDPSRWQCRHRVLTLRAIHERM